MYKYIKFGLRFLKTYYFHKTYNFSGYLPYYQQVSPGTLAKVIGGGEFKYTELYVSTEKGWVLLETDENKVRSLPSYIQQQKEIAEELRRLNPPTKEQIEDEERIAKEIQELENS